MLSATARETAAEWGIFFAVSFWCAQHTPHTHIIHRTQPESVELVFQWFYRTILITSNINRTHWVHCECRWQADLVCEQNNATQSICSMSHHMDMFIGTLLHRDGAVTQRNEHKHVVSLLGFFVVCSHHVTPDMSSAPVLTPFAVCVYVCSERKMEIWGAPHLRCIYI